MSAITSRPARRLQRAVMGWMLLAALAFVALPWYLPQNLGFFAALRGVFGDAESASGLMQALLHKRPWLWALPVALALVAVGWSRPAGRAQGRWITAGAALGLAALLFSGFTIGATGWAFEGLQRSFGELAVGQFGIGLGGALALVALLMLLGAGVARLGYFRGDMFVAGAVVFCGALLLLFVALPVLRSLWGAWLDEEGRLSLSTLWQRLVNERIWGLGCLGGGVRCGVAWNTLVLALLTAAGTTLMGTLIALVGGAWRPPVGQGAQCAGAAAHHHAALRGGPWAGAALRARGPLQSGAGVGLWA